MKSQAFFQMRICSREGFGSNCLKLRWTVGLKNLNYGIAGQLGAIPQLRGGIQLGSGNCNKLFDSINVSMIFVYDGS